MLEVAPYVSMLVGCDALGRYEDVGAVVEINIKGGRECLLVEHGWCGGIEEDARQVVGVEEGLGTNTGNGGRQVHTLQTRIVELFLHDLGNTFRNVDVLQGKATRKGRLETGDGRGDVDAPQGAILVEGVADGLQTFGQDDLGDAAAPEEGTIAQLDDAVAVDLGWDGQLSRDVTVNGLLIVSSNSNGHVGFADDLIQHFNAFNGQCLEGVAVSCLGTDGSRQQEDGSEDILRMFHRF